MTDLTQLLTFVPDEENKKKVVEFCNLTEEARKEVEYYTKQIGGIFKQLNIPPARFAPVLMQYKAYFDKKLTKEDVIKHDEILLERQKLDEKLHERKIKERELSLKEESSKSTNVLIEALDNIRKAKVVIEKGEPLTSKYDFLYETRPELSSCHNSLEKSIEKIEKLIEDIK